MKPWYLCPESQLTDKPLLPDGGSSRTGFLCEDYSSQLSTPLAVFCISGLNITPLPHIFLHTPDLHIPLPTLFEWLPYSSSYLLLLYPCSLPLHGLQSQFLHASQIRYSDEWIKVHMDIFCRVDKVCMFIIETWTVYIWNPSALTSARSPIFSAWNCRIYFSI